MIDSVKKLQKGLERLQEGVDILKDAYAPLTKDLQVNEEAFLESSLPFVEEALKGLAALEEMGKQLATTESNLRETLISLIPSVESNLSYITTLCQKTEQTIRGLSKITAQSESSVISSSTKTLEYDSISDVTDVRSCSTDTTELIKQIIHEVMKEKKEKKANKVKTVYLAKISSPNKISGWEDISIINQNSLHRSKNPSKALMQAINEGKRSEVRSLIAEGADINVKSNSGRTAMSVAALRDHPDCMSELIKAGANISARNKDGSTALHEAVIHGKKKSLNILLSSGINVDLKSQRGMTALAMASKCGHKACESELLKFCDRQQTVTVNI